MLAFVSFLIGTASYYLFLFFPFTVAAVSLSASICLISAKRFLLFSAFILGAAHCFLRYDPPQAIPYTRSVVDTQGTITSLQGKTAGGYLKHGFRVRAVEGTLADGLRSLQGKEIVLLSESGYEIGRDYGFGISLLKSNKRMNPGESGPDAVYAVVKEVRDTGERGKTLDIYVQEARHKIQRYFEEHYPPDSAAFLSSVTVGQGPALDGRLREAFNSTGLAHILSISGTHFGLLSFLLFGGVRLVVRAMPYAVLQRLTMYLTPSQSAALVCLPVMVTYLLLSGASIPAVRSFLMIGLFLLGLLIDRRGFWLNSLLFAAFVIILWDPGALLSLSFQLSFLAVFFIGLSIRKDEDRENSGWRSLRPVRDAFLMSFAAAAGTAPLVSYHFHYISLISPLSNLLVAPLIGFILIPMSVVASLLYLLTGHFIFSYPISVVTAASLYLVELSARVPFADVRIRAFPAIAVILFYAGLAAYFVSGKRRLWLTVSIVPAAFLVLVPLFQKDEMSATFLDVGQGDSSVLELPDGRAMVIDTGTTGREAASFLRYTGRRSIDILALSHAHPDHAGGLDYLAEQFSIGEIWDNGRLILPAGLKGIRHRSLNRGDIVEGNGYRISVLHPYPGFYTAAGREYDSENNDSLVFRIEGGGSSFLYAGDIGTEAEDDVLYLGQWLKSSVLKVPHHGGETSAHELFVRSVSPAAAVISVGRQNTFGHPRQETLESLQGSSIYRTDTDGAVRIMPEAGRLRIRTCRDFRLERAESFSDEMKNYARLCNTW